MSTTLWNDVTVVVPFRLPSKRFPNKALCRYRGKTLIEHAIANAAGLTPRRIVLTAPTEDLDTVGSKLDLDGLGRDLPVELIVCPSSASCWSATERVLELFPSLDGGLFLSLPIDEPAIRPSELSRVVRDTAVFDDAGVITFCCDFYCEEDYLSPLSAKVVLDRRARILYMSRGIIPVRKDGSADPSMLKNNVGAFLFKRSFLEELAAEASVSTALDRHEGCEQLRWIELGFSVKCLEIEHVGLGIDIPEQVAELEARVERVSS